MDRIAHIISNVFHPLLIPAYGMIMSLTLTPLCIVPASEKAKVITVILSLTGILPLMLIISLKTIGLVSDIGLNDRKQRLMPYSAALVLYVAALFYLYVGGVPGWMFGFMLGASIALAAVTVITQWWKISAHATAMGGLVAFTLSLVINIPVIVPMLWITISVIMAAGAVGTSRLILRRHTPMQLIAGTATGFTSVYLCTLI